MNITKYLTLSSLCLTVFLVQGQTSSDVVNNAIKNAKSLTAQANGLTMNLDYVEDKRQVFDVTKVFKTDEDINKLKKYDAQIQALKEKGVALDKKMDGIVDRTANMQNPIARSAINNMKKANAAMNNEMMPDKIVVLEIPEPVRVTTTQPVQSTVMLKTAKYSTGQSVKNSVSNSKTGQSATVNSKTDQSATVNRNTNKNQSSSEGSTKSASKPTRTIK